MIVQAMQLIVDELRSYFDREKLMKLYSLIEELPTQKEYTKVKNDVFLLRKNFEPRLVSQLYNDVYLLDARTEIQRTISNDRPEQLWIYDDGPTVYLVQRNNTKECSLEINHDGVGFRIDTLNKKELERISRFLLEYSEGMD